MLAVAVFRQLLHASRMDHNAADLQKFNMTTLDTHYNFRQEF